MLIRTNPLLHCGLGMRGMALPKCIGELMEELEKGVMRYLPLSSCFYVGTQSPPLISPGSFGGAGGGEGDRREEDVLPPHTVFPPHHMHTPATSDGSRTVLTTRDTQRLVLLLSRRVAGALL